MIVNVSNGQVQERLVTLTIKKSIKVNKIIFDWC